MKVSILGIIAFAMFAHGSVIPWPAATTTLVRTPSLDSAVIQSERLNGAFSYSTVENHAYAPVVQTYATYPWNYYPNIYYHTQQYPTYTFVQQPPVTFLPGGVQSPGSFIPGQQPPVEVEDPADNTENQEIKQEINNTNTDDDTVSVESV